MKQTKKQKRSGDVSPVLAPANFASPGCKGDQERADAWHSLEKAELPPLPQDRRREWSCDWGGFMSHG
jgi:hypothetical protein